MKNKLFVVVIFLLGYASVYAQSKGINFQSIVVDASGAIEVSQEVDFKFDFYYNSDLSTVIYSETQSKTTNNKGLVSLVIGDGTKLSSGAELADLDWSEEITLKVSRQVSGSYQLLFSQTVASVPIAFYAKKAGSLEGVTVASGVVSATGFKGDGSELTNLSINSSTNSLTLMDEYSNVVIGSELKNLDPISSDGNVAIGKLALSNITSGTNNIAVGNRNSLSITSGVRNIAIGNGALSQATTGEKNVAIGTYALSSNVTGTTNIAIGEAALASNKADSNIAIGESALGSNITGSSNTAVGKLALVSNQSGYGNEAFGNYSLRNNVNGFHNLAIGSGALNNNVAGSQSTAIGKAAMYFANNSSTEFSTFNTAIGYEALRGSREPANNTGINNTVIGHRAMYLNESGSENIAVGVNALMINTTGHSNVAIGYSSSVRNQDGYYNTSLGWSTMTGNESGYENTAIGAHSMAVNTTGYANTAVGRVSLHWNLDGINNVALGSSALFANTSGSYNTAVGTAALNNIEESNNTGVGYFAGTSLVSGTLNTLIGFRADSANNISNSTAIGANAIVTTSNTIQLGDSNVTLVQTSGTISATTINSSNEININSSLPSIDLKNTSDSEQNQIRFMDKSGRILTRIDNSSNNSVSARFRIVSYQPIQLSARADPGTDRASNTNYDFGFFKLDDRSASIEINGGTLTIDGYATSSGFSTASDIRIKKNIKDLDYGLDDLVKMRPVKYNLVSNNSIEIGLIAQDVKKIIPELVKGKEGLIENGEVLSINYNGFAPIIIKALQEQNNTIESQKNKIEKMEQEILALKAAIEKLITE